MSSIQEIIAYYRLIMFNFMVAHNCKKSLRSMLIVHMSRSPTNLRKVLIDSSDDELGDLLILLKELLERLVEAFVTFDPMHYWIAKYLVMAQLERLNDDVLTLTLSS